MQVFMVRYTNKDQDEVEVSSDLGDFYLPWPCRSWHRQAIHEWLEAGNRIQAYQKDENPELLRQALVREVYSQAARILDAATAEYAIAEQIIWPGLEREARGFLLDGSIGPLMKTALEEGGRSTEELAYAIIHKANRLNRLRGMVIRARSRHVSRLNQTDLKGLESYDVARGWPESVED